MRQFIVRIAFWVESDKAEDAVDLARDTERYISSKGEKVIGIKHVKITQCIEEEEDE